MLGRQPGELGSPYYSPPATVPEKKDRPVPVFASRWRLQGEHNGRGTMTITRMAMMAWMAGTVAHGGEPQQKVSVYLRERAAVHPEVRIPEIGRAHV